MLCHTTVDLDIAFEQGDLLEALMLITKDYDSITYRVIELQGSGGGWPNVRFSGTMPDLSAFLLEYTAGDREWAEELLLA